MPHLWLLHQQRLTVAHGIDGILDELGTVTEEAAKQPRYVEMLLSLPGEWDYQGLRTYPGRCARYLAEWKESGGDHALWLQSSSPQPIGHG